MTEKRPSDLILDWGLMPKPHGWSRLDGKQPEPEHKELESEQQREANRKELELKPERDYRDTLTIQGPGMGAGFVNPRVETPEQRATRQDKDRDYDPPEPEKQSEPPALDKAAERVRQIDDERPGRRMLAPWERDPRWGA